MGVAAVDAVHAGHTDHMVALRADRIIVVPLSDVVGRDKPLADEIWGAANVFFS